MAGKLYVCATPIGNLEDTSYRIIRTLNEVDLIACEDTRVTKKLCGHFSLSTPLTSYHEHNKYEKADYLVKKMLEGEDVALVSDAGTPAISDPGEELVKKAYEAGIVVTSIPGPAACITALTLSGLSTRRFCFEGFLPQIKKERLRVLEELKMETRTILLYEAPHKLKKTLKDLEETLGNRRISIVKELTKIHETVFRTTITEAISYFEENEPRGEYVLVTEGKNPEEIKKEKEEQFCEMDLFEHMERYRKQGVEKKEAMKLVAKDRGVPKREIYKLLLKERYLGGFYEE